MPTKLITKNSSTASAVPTAGQLDQGELAVNVTDKRLFTKDSGGTVRELGTNPTSITTGTIDATTITADGLTVDGASTITQATDTPLTIAYNGSNSSSYGYYQIVNNNTGNPFEIHTGGSKTLRLEANGDVSLYEDTGTTAKFFWDASAERLGVGLAAPTVGKIHADGASASDSGVYASAAGASKYALYGVHSGVYGMSGYYDGSNYWSFYGNGKGYFGGNVGIGTSSPSWQLHCKTDGSQFPTFETTSTTSDVAINLIQGANAFTLGYDDSQDLLKVVRGTASSNTGIGIDSSGNVGIGTVSPLTALHCIGSTSGTLTNAQQLLGTGNIENVRMLAYNAGGNQAGIGIQAGSSGSAAVGLFAEKATTNAANFIIRMDTGTGTSAERARIDSSGTLLVGRTNSATGNAGLVVYSNGLIKNEVVSDTVCVHNRMTTDGDITQFRKDGTTVGSIGSYAGGYSYYSSVGAGYLALSGTATLAWESNKIYPNTDTALDLGSSARRFKDLYLSGGVYLGGTGAANHLDDYEEGTWTPTLPNGGTLTVLKATYTKVGRLVKAQCFISAIAPTNDGQQFRIGGLPFTSQSDVNNYHPIVIGYQGDSNLADWMGLVAPNTTYAYFHIPANIAPRSNSAYLTQASGGTDQLILNFVYDANS